MFSLGKTGNSDLASLERIEALVRARYGVAESDIVLVTEEAGRAPGEPPMTTTILFWREGGVRHRLRLFKCAAQVAEGDLPPGWLRGALVDAGEGECC